MASQDNLKAQLRKRIVRGLTWSTLGSGVSQVLALLVGVLLARWLGQESYGELGVVQANIALFTVFAGPTLGVTAAKFVSEFRDADKHKAANLLGHSLRQGFWVSVSIAAVFVFLAPLIAEQALQKPELTLALRLSAIALFFAGIDGVQRGGLTGFEAFRAIAIVNVVKGIVSIPVLLWLVHSSGLNGAVIGLGAVGAFGCLGNYFALRRARRMCDLPQPTQVSGEDRREIGSIYWPTLAAALVQMPVAWLLSILLVRQPGGLQEMGLLNAATNWRLAILFLPTMINSTFVPMLNNTLGAGEPAMFRRLALANIGVSTLASAVPALVIALAAEPIMGFHGPGFKAGTGVLVALAVAAVLAAASGPVGNLLIALRRAWYGTALNGSTAVVTVVSFLSLIDQGAQGVAWAWLIGYSWHFLASMAVMLFVFRSAVSPTR